MNILDHKKATLLCYNKSTLFIDSKVSHNITNSMKSKHIYKLYKDINITSGGKLTT